jgi:hypothetical protein
VKLTDSQVRAWIDSLVGFHGPDDGSTPNSPCTAAFIRGVFLGTGYIPTYSQLRNLKDNEQLRQFRSFLEAVLSVLVASGIECAPESEVPSAQ